MKQLFILIIALVCTTFCFCQSTTVQGKEYPVKSVAFFTGIAIPMGDFTKTGYEFGPSGNANPGVSLAGTVDLQWKHYGWRFEAGANFNPVNSSNLYITEMYPDAEIKHWTGTKLLTGPFMNFKLKKSSLRVGAQTGALWLRYPTVIISEGNKIQPIPRANFAGQLYAEWSYPVSEKMSVGINIKYEFSNAEVKFREVRRFYQMGNTFNLEYEAGRPFRMTNDPPPGPTSTGWIGTGRAENSTKQKVTNLQIGFHLQMRLQ